MKVSNQRNVSEKFPVDGKATAKVKKGGALTSANRVTALRKRLQLTQGEFARLLPISVRSLATLEHGTPPTEAIARRLTELNRLTKALAEVVKEESLGHWLQTPNSAFDGLKPIEVIDRGECDRLWGMIFFLRSGTVS